MHWHRMRRVEQEKNYEHCACMWTHFSRHALNTASIAVVLKLNAVHNTEEGDGAHLFLFGK
jgi:hypothetical protein